MYWQAVTLLDPHFTVGTKDQKARIFYEPPAGWDGDGNRCRSSLQKFRARRTIDSPNSHSVISN